MSNNEDMLTEIYRAAAIKAIKSNPIEKVTFNQIMSLSDNKLKVEKKYEYDAMFAKIDRVFLQTLKSRGKTVQYSKPLQDLTLYEITQQAGNALIQMGYTYQQLKQMLDEELKSSGKHR